MVANEPNKTTSFRKKKEISFDDSNIASAVNIITTHLCINQPSGKKT